MSKKNQIRHPADLWVEKKIQQYPGCLALAETFYEGKRDKNPEFEANWPDWCGLPMGCVYAILTGGVGSQLAQRRMAELGIAELPNLTAALLWSQSKAVYKFDETLAEKLLHQPMDDKLPTEALFHLPHFCVFVDYPLTISGKRALGTFLWAEYDCNSKVPELRILALFPDNTTLSLPIILSGGTLNDSMVALALSAQKRYNPALGLTQEFVDQRMVHFLEQQVTGIINMALYLCSDEPDIPNLAITRSKNFYGHPKHSLTWDVGTRIGASIRNYRKLQTTSNVEQAQGHSSPRPHIRRAHWHHFWVGSHDSSSRRLIVKWVLPIPVNIGKNEMPTVITRVHKKAENKNNNHAQ